MSSGLLLGDARVTGACVLLRKRNVLLFFFQVCVNMLVFRCTKSWTCFLSEGNGVGPQVEKLSFESSGVDVGYILHFSDSK